MSTLNSIPFTAAGHLTADPELRFTGTGKPVTGLRIAVTPRRYDRDTNGYADGTTTFVDGQVWGEQAEHMAESVHKGDRVLVIGRWVTPDLHPDAGPERGVGAAPPRGRGRRDRTQSCLGHRRSHQDRYPHRSGHGDRLNLVPGWDAGRFR